MRRGALLAVGVLGCGPATAPTTAAPPVIVNQEAAPPCVVAVGNPAGTLAIDGVAIRDLELATLHAALGPPDRVERIVEEQRYEEWGMSPGDGRTSSLVSVVDYHHVYDRRGLVFRTRNDQFGDNQTPALLLLFFDHPRRFDNAPAPAVVPADRGGCRLEINGVAVDPDADARPAGVTWETDRFERFGTTFAPTSVDMVVDRIYTEDGRPHVDLFLDDDSHGRPSYAEILP